MQRRLTEHSFISRLNVEWLQTFRLLASCGPHLKSLVVDKVDVLEDFCAVIRLCPNVEHLKLVEIRLSKEAISEVERLVRGSLVSLLLEKCAFHVSLQVPNAKSKLTGCIFIGSRGPYNCSREEFQPSSLQSGEPPQLGDSRR